MKKTLLEILRWIAILFFAAVGVLFLIGFGPSYLTSSGWLKRLFVIGFILFFAGPPFLISYVLYKREYRSLIRIFATLLGFVVLFGLMSAGMLYKGLPFQPQPDKPWATLLSLGISMICLIGPFVAVAWIFRLSRRLERWLEKREKLRAGRRL